jgi:CRISPR/Cas system CSM-associated protein Csm2 small subunit
MINKDEILNRWKDIIAHAESTPALEWVAYQLNRKGMLTEELKAAMAERIDQLETERKEAGV